MKINERKYKWVVLIGCSLVLMSYFGVINNIFSIYIIPVCEDLGFTRSSFTMMQTLYFAAATVMSLFAAKIFEKFGTLKVLRLSCVALMIVYCLNGLSSSLMMFYILWILIGFLMSLNCVVPTTIIIRQWFSNNVGTAIGIAQAMSGFGGLIFNQIAKKTLLISGWRLTYFVLGLIMGILGIIATFILIKERPVEQSKNDAVDIQHSNIRKNPVDWSVTIPLMICFALFTCTHNSIFFTATPFIQDSGYSLTYAANVASIIMGVFGVGKFLFGYIADRVGMKIVSALSGISVCLGNIGLILFPLIGTPAVVLMCINAGFCSPFSNVGAALLPDTTASDYSEQAMSLYIAGVNFGAAVAPILSSLFYDKFGTYIPYYKLAVVLTIIQLVIILRTINKCQDKSSTIVS